MIKPATDRTWPGRIYRHVNGWKFSQFRGGMGGELRNDKPATDRTCPGRIYRHVNGWKFSQFQGGMGGELRNCNKEMKWRTVIVFSAIRHVSIFHAMMI